MQGVGVPDEDLTQDRGLCGKQDAVPGGGGGAARRGRMTPARDEGENTTMARCGLRRGIGRLGPLATGPL